MEILTVSGIKEIKNSNIIDSHVHLWAKKPQDFFDYSMPEVNEKLIVKDCLRSFKKNGGSLVIDCTPYECGRDGKILHHISKKTGVEVVCVTGFHRREYYPPGI